VTSVLIDGEEVALAGGRATVSLDPGSHEVVAQLPPSEQRRAVVIARGGSFELDLSPAVQPERRATKPRALPVWPFIVGGSGLVLGAIAGGLAGSGAMETSKLYELCPEKDGLPTCASGADIDEADDIRNGILVRNGVAIGAAAAGGALLVTGIVGLVVGPAGDEASVGVVPAVSPSHVGLIVGGRFQ
jgi:hypothetical protein